MSSAGDILEARVQRLFLAQGIFAERSLFPAADVAHSLLATDIDVLVSEYSSGFHLTRRHAECKSGRKVAILDRVLWLSGVRTLLGADASYLVVEAFNEDATDFARSLAVDVMTIRQLKTWEEAFGIPEDRWPSRSNFSLIDPIKGTAQNLGKQKSASPGEKVVREAIQFVEIDSWRHFGYARLNRLLRLLMEVSELTKGAKSKEGRSIGAYYAASALIVRLSQYLLAVCLDISRVPLSDVKSYLLNKLTYGDQDANRARGLVQSTVEWMSQALKDRGMVVPPEANAIRLFRPPEFSEGLIALVEKLLGSPNEARYLPVAMETDQFGNVNEIEMFPRLRSAWNTGRGLAALVRAFVVASVGVDSSLLTPLHQRLANLPTGRTSMRAKVSSARANRSQLKLANS